MSQQRQVGKTERYLEFSLDSEVYAIPLLTVKEVIAYPEITSIPHTPVHFLGITNLRGQVISVVDLRKKLGLQAKIGAETVVIICDVGSLSLGVVVNSANSVLQLGPEQIQPKPEIQSSKSSDYLLGVAQKDQKMVLLLDIAKALDVNDRLAMNQAVQTQVVKAA